MSHSTAEARALPSRASATSASLPAARLVVVAFAALFLWGEIVYQLSSEWSLNPQYGYGWTVPFLAAFLFYLRWSRTAVEGRPPCHPRLLGITTAREAGDGTAPVLPRPTISSGLTIALMVFAALMLLPLRIVAVANPDWRLLNWLMALVVVFISLGAFYRAGGWGTLRHFAFPVLFFLVAVPWPVQLETIVVQNLMRADAAITVGLLNFIGTLAVQHGNVIELSTGQVGIDDACTGVRSLQATFMVALFFGAFYRMPWSRRLLLVLAGAGVAFICNIGRTLLLCEIAANEGIAAIHRWHDPAGFTILFICLFVLWGLSLWLQPPAPPEEQRVVRLGSFPSLGWSLALLLWLALTEIAVAGWYAQRVSAAAIPWKVAWPTSELAFQKQPIPSAAEALLRYNDGGAATWQSADDRRWMMYSFRWLPGRTAALFVKNHRPDICLPASGLTMQQETTFHFATAHGAHLPIHAYRFDDHGQPLHIFYCYWDGRSSSAIAEDWTARGRLRAAWKGQRERGARMFELAVWGHADDTEAQAALQRELTKIIQPG